jgi:ABC-type multidrug transport system ATPase subunit
VASDYLFAADSVRKSYWGNEVLTSAGFWVNAGRITTLMGRNGSGKTTIIKVSIGLLRATSGVVRFRENRYVRPRLSQLAREGLFYLPQTGLLDPYMAVRRQFDWLERRYPESEPATAFETMRISERMLASRPMSLSGGERRRCEIALAFARKPDCLVADEPYLGVMPSDVEIVTAGFRDLARSGAGILLSGHEVEHLFAATDDLIWVTSNTTHYIGSPVEALQHRQFVAEYLGVERMRQLRTTYGM